MQQLFVPKTLVKYICKPANGVISDIYKDYELLKSVNSTIGVIASKQVLKNVELELSGFKIDRIEKNQKALTNDHLITYQYDSEKMEPYFTVFLKYVGAVKNENSSKPGIIKAESSSKSREYLDFLLSKTGTVGLFKHLAFNILAVVLFFHFFQSSKFDHFLKQIFNSNFT